MIDAALYLIPVPLSDVRPDAVLPAPNLAIVREIKHFVVENLRSARRFLKACDPAINIDELSFAELNRHTPPERIDTLLKPLIDGSPLGVISEAGCPAIADPGADLVDLAQRRRLRVIPLVGPSSILMGLMASGFNGQSFAFNGYLPIDARERQVTLQQLQRRITHEHQTQIFIETPYRNRALATELIQRLPPALRLCIATDITGPDERITTRSIAQWRQQPPQLDKIPTIFLLYK